MAGRSRHIQTEAALSKISSIYNKTVFFVFPLLPSFVLLLHSAQQEGRSFFSPRPPTFRDGNESGGFGLCSQAAATHPGWDPSLLPSLLSRGAGGAACGGGGGGGRGKSSMLSAGPSWLGGGGGGGGRSSNMGLDVALGCESFTNTSSLSLSWGGGDACNVDSEIRSETLPGKLGTPGGEAGSEVLQELGGAHCFQQGFGSTFSGVQDPPGRLSSRPVDTHRPRAARGRWACDTLFLRPSSSPGSGLLGAGPLGLGGRLTVSPSPLRAVTAELLTGKGCRPACPSLPACWSGANWEQEVKGSGAG